MRMIGMMSQVAPRKLLVSLVAVIVALQASACCCLGGAEIPPMTPFPISKEPGYQMRERLNEVKAKGGAFAVEISDQELTSYIVLLLQSGAGEFPARDMQIQFSENQVDVWATFIEIAPTDVPAFARAQVEAQSGHLVIRLEKVHLSLVSIPGAMREMLSQILSETLAELQQGLEIDRVELNPGSMRLSGRVTGDLPDLPERLW